MKGKTRITMNRETLREMIEQNIARTFGGTQQLDGFTIARNGSVEVTIVPVDNAAVRPLRLTFGDEATQPGPAADDSEAAG